MWANNNLAIKTETIKYDAPPNVPGKLAYRLDFDTQCRLNDYDIVLLQLMIDNVQIQTKYVPGTQNWSTVDPFDGWAPDPPKPVRLWPTQTADATLVATAYTSLKMPTKKADGGILGEIKDPWSPEDWVDGQFSVPRRAVMGIARFTPPFDNTKISYPNDEEQITSFAFPVGAAQTKWLADIQGTLRGDVRGQSLPSWLNMRSPYMVVGYPPLGTLRFSISCFSRLHGEEIPFRANCSYAVWGWKYPS